jgi:isoquinoline 1-oxidoreductase beta subunit
MRATPKVENCMHVNRRGFLRTSAAAAGGLLVSLYLDLPAAAQEGNQAPPAKVYPPDAFVNIRPDGKIVIQVNRLEFGQGIHTGLPRVLADEMDADWANVIAQLAPAADVYKDPLYGIQLVGGSGSIARSFQQYRELGAKTRAMLVAAAADRWRTTPDKCRTEASVVHGPAGQSATYAELASEAARKPVPTTVRLKNPTEFRLVGKPAKRLESRPKCDGSLKFGLDLDLPGMKVAVVAHPPVFGGRVKSINDVEARRVEGVLDVFEIPLVRGAGVAIVADKFWPAKRARSLLKIEWDLAGVEAADSESLSPGLMRTGRGRPSSRISRICLSSSSTSSRSRFGCLINSRSRCPSRKSHPALK